MQINKKLAHLAKRRQQLIEQAATQRIALARNIEPLRKPLATAEHGIRVIRYIKQHPAFAIGATALFGLLRRTRAVQWLKNGWAMLQITRSLHNLL